MPLSVQFENIGENAEFPIANLVTVGNPAGSLSLGTGADQIWLWDTSAADWVKYLYRSGRGVTTPVWGKKGETIATTDTIAAGTTFFFYRGGSAATTISLGESAPWGVIYKLQKWYNAFLQHMAIKWF